MTFRQIIAQYSPVDCKNKLNDLLALVERNFGVFSPDMELDIRAVISKDEVKDYFDRIIHEAYPELEYDEIKKQPKSPKNKNIPTQETPKQRLRRKRKEAMKRAKREKARQQGIAIREAEKNRENQQDGNSIVPDFAMKRLAKNGRDYSKPSLGSKINRSRQSNGKEKPREWVSIIYTPMGGQNKKY